MPDKLLSLHALQPSRDMKCKMWLWNCNPRQSISRCSHHKRPRKLATASSRMAFSHHPSHRTRITAAIPRTITTSAKCLEYMGLEHRRRLPVSNTTRLTCTICRNSNTYRIRSMYREWCWHTRSGFLVCMHWLVGLRGFQHFFAYLLHGSLSAKRVGFPRALVWHTLSVLGS